MQWEEEDNPVVTTPENILFNFVTHSTSHRGQLPILLRFLGFDQIEDTDYNPYINELGQNR